MNKHGKGWEAPVLKLDFSATNVINNLLHDSDFSDVTLVCGDNQYISAHRAVLSCSSPFLRRLLYDSQQQSTFLYLGQAQTEEVEALLKFIYLGSCAVHKSRLEALKTLAAGLGVEGFQDSVSDDTDFQMEPIQKDVEKFIDVHLNSPETDNMISDDNYSEPKEETRRSPFRKTSDYVDSQENLKVSVGVEGFEDIVSDDTDFQKEPIQKEVEKYIDVHFNPPETDNIIPDDDYSEPKEETYISPLSKTFEYVDSQENLNVSEKTFGKVTFMTENKSLKIEDSDVGQELIKKKKIKKQKHDRPFVDLPFPDESGNFFCNECDKTFKSKYNLRDHKLSYHEGFTYDCDQCTKQFKSTASLDEHRNSIHRGLYLSCTVCGLNFTSERRL